jgi:hypothetical protein
VPHGICTSDAGGCYFWPAIPSPTHLLDPRPGSNRSPVKALLYSGDLENAEVPLEAVPGRTFASGSEFAGCHRTRWTPFGRSLCFEGHRTSFVAPLSGVCAYCALPPKSHPSKLTATLASAIPTPASAFFARRGPLGTWTIASHTGMPLNHHDQVSGLSCLVLGGLSSPAALSSGPDVRVSKGEVTSTVLPSPRRTPALPVARATERQPTGRSRSLLSAKSISPAMPEPTSPQVAQGLVMRRGTSVGENGEAKSQSGIARKASQCWTRGVGLFPKAQPNCSATDMQVACGLLPRERG